MRTPSLPVQPERTVRVLLLIDEQPIYLHGLQSILAAQPALHCVGVAGSCADAAAQAPMLQPDVVLADAGLALSSSEGGLLALQPHMPKARFVVISASSETVRECRAEAAGASVALHHSASAEDLVAAIFSAHGDRRSAAARLADGQFLQRSREAVGADLTRRERDLLALMAKGLSNNDISGALDIAMPTVKFHVGNIMSKLQAENRTRAVLVALRHKLVPLS